MKVIDSPRLGQDTADSLYERDFHAWSEQQAALLRAGQVDALDRENLAEEIQSMGSSNRRELITRLEQLLMHLLKWRYQPGHRGASWEISIDKQRNALEDLFDESPSLRTRLPDVRDKAYVRARRQASRETGLPLATFPETCPFTLEQVLDDGYWPD